MNQLYFVPSKQSIFLVETVSRIHFKLAHLFNRYRPTFDIRIHNRWATG